MLMLPLDESDIARSLNQPRRLTAVENLLALDLPVPEIQEHLEGLADRLGGNPLCAATCVDLPPLPPPPHRAG